MKNGLILLFYWLPFLSSGQVVTVSESLSIRNNNAYELLGKLKDQVLLYQKKGRHQFEIQAYDERLRLSWNKALQFDNKKANVIAMIPDRDQFSVIYSYIEEGIIHLKVHKYDPEVNLIDSTTIARYTPRLGLTNFRSTYSEDRESVLLFGIQNQSKVKALSFHLKTMQLRWANEFSIATAQFNTNHMEVLVTNQGEMYFVIAHDNRKAKKDQHRYEVQYYQQGLKQVKRMVIPMEGQLSFDILFSFDNLNHNLVAGGLYAQNSLNRANGYFSLKLPNQHPEKYDLQFIPFDDAFISDIGDEKIKDSEGLKNVGIREIVLRRDGGMLLVYEAARLYKRQPSMIRANGPINNYYYGNLLVLSLHPDGKTHWKNILYKKQNSQDDEAAFSSYFLLKAASSLRFLFNDEIKYENTVSEYVVKGNGASDRNSLLSTEDQDIRLRFQDAIQIASNELLIPSESRYQLRLVRVTY